MAPINSISTIANGLSYEELLIMIRSFDLWNKADIYVFCDKEVGDKLSTIMLERCPIHVLPSMPEHLSKANRRNSFGSLLRCKMDAVEPAIREKGNTLFVDADIIFLSKVNGIDLDKYDVAVSPHGIKKADELKWGFYNAGYIAIRNPEFPKWWREACNTSKYVDQECLTRAPDHFNCQMLGFEHNFGWWRILQAPSNDEKKRRITSFHVNENIICYENNPLISAHLHLRLAKSNILHSLLKGLLSRSSDPRHKTVLGWF